MSSQFIDDEFLVNLSVDKLHRVSNLRPALGEWTDQKYTFKVTCVKCGKYQELIHDKTKTVAKCNKCNKEVGVRMNLVFDEEDPKKKTNILNKEETVSVMNFDVNSRFTVDEKDGECEVGLDLIIWHCNVEKKDNPDEFVERTFYLKKGKFTEGDQLGGASSGWNNDDSDRPCVKLTCSMFDNY